MISSRRKQKILIYALFLMVSFLLLSCYADASPYFPMSSRSDSLINFLVGRSLNHGMIVYRDFMEQRGPILYFIQAAAAWISENSMIGVFLIEVLFSWLFLISIYLTVQIFHKNAVQFVPYCMLLAWLIYSSKAFSGGNLPEEFNLTAISFSQCILLKALKEDRLISEKEGFWVGVCAGFALWVKYTMCGYYLGAMIPFLMKGIREKNSKGIHGALLGVLLGICIITIPVIVFYAVNGALADLIHVYFLKNITEYTYGNSIRYKLFYTVTGTLKTISENLILWIVIIAGLVLLFVKKAGRYIFGEVLGTLLTTLFFVYQGGWLFSYYGFFMAIFSVPVLFCLPPLKKQPGTVFVCGLVMLFLYLSMETWYSVRNQKLSDIAEYRLSEKMDTDGTLMLYHSTDVSFYYFSGKDPAVYYPWIMNLNTSEMKSIQDEYVRQGLTDYVVSETAVLISDSSYNYKIIAHDTKGSTVYYLFKRVKKNEGS